MKLQAQGPGEVKINRVRSFSPIVLGALVESLGRLCWYRRDLHSFLIRSVPAEVVGRCDFGNLDRYEIAHCLVTDLSTMGSNGRSIERRSANAELQIKQHGLVDQFSDHDEPASR